MIGRCVSIYLYFICIYVYLRDVLKESEHGQALSAADSAASSDAAVGQLIDFDTDTPPPAPTNAMANLCKFHSAADLENLVAYFNLPLLLFWLLLVKATLV